MARHPTLATFLVMAIVVNIAMISFSSTFWLLRATNAASNVACPLAVPDRQTPGIRAGNYQTEGAPGQFSSGEGQLVADRAAPGQARPTSPSSPTAAVACDRPTIR